MHNVTQSQKLGEGLTARYDNKAHQTSNIKPQSLLKVQNLCHQLGWSAADQASNNVVNRFCAICFGAKTHLRTILSYICISVKLVYSHVFLKIANKRP